MQEKWLSLSDIPAEGREFSFQDDQVWGFLWEKNKLPCTMGESLTVWVNIIPQKKGFYIQGTIKGAVFLPCNRCLEQARVVIDNSFGIFEEFEPVDPEYIQKPLLRFAEGHWELDLQHLFWEQFLLALPDKYLCSEDCKGLCPHCGQNLNEKSCSCEQSAGDPRLAVLREWAKGKGLKAKGEKGRQKVIL